MDSKKTSLPVSFNFFVCCILMTATFLYINFVAAVDSVPLKKPFTEFPKEVDKWISFGDHTFDEKIMNILRVDDFIYRTYRDDKKNNVQLYIGYYQSQREGAQIHSPKNCLPGSGWAEVSSRERTVNHKILGQLNFVEAVYEKGGKKEVFLYWYDLQDMMITNEYILKMSMVYSSILNNRSDAAFVRISSLASGKNVEETIGVAEKFLLTFFPEIESFLPGS